jgi:hypothetical protein
MALTGRAEAAPLGPPASLVGRVQEVARSLAAHTGVALDALALLGERAAISGFSRRGAVSCGGSARLLPTADGWLAVSLPRRSDLEAVPAWLGVAVRDEDPWAAVAYAVRQRDGSAVVERARLLGLAVAQLGEAGPGVKDQSFGTYRPRSIDGALVVDLSSLWAGPLCTHLLSLAGARVVKVESTGRPDGARDGPAAFFDLLNVGKESVALDFADARDRETLRRLVSRADIVVEGSRRRALEQVGVVAAAILVEERAPAVWLSITGHGRSADRVAFGDDAAVAGGLVVTDGDGPCFCADAVADPLTGLVAAERCAAMLAAGERAVVDLPMAAVAADFAGPTLAAAPDAVVAEPRARPVLGRGPALGEHTAAVLAELV